jgi:hypothetical protein
MDLVEKAREGGMGEGRKHKKCKKMRSEAGMSFRIIKTAWSEPGTNPKRTGNELAANPGQTGN